MYTKDAIRFSMNLAEQSVMRSIGTMKDAPLTFPTENGGCHPLWVLGHLTVVEGMTHQLLAGGENPAAEWGALFGPDTITTSDASHYPSFEEVSARYAELRQKNLARHCRARAPVPVSRLRACGRAGLCGVRGAQNRRTRTGALGQLPEVAGRSPLP